MAWSAASGPVRMLHDDRDDMLLGLVSPGHSSLTQDYNHGSNKKRAYNHAVKEEVDEDDLSDELSNQAEKKRRLTVEQVKFLEMSFNKDLKLEPERKALLAKQLGIRPRQVAIWFQNRRARWKNKQLEQDYENLKAKCDTIMKEKEIILREHEAALAEKERLEAQVVRLMSLLESPASNGARDVMGVGSVGSEGKSDLTSPSKSVEDQSDTQDSGQSYPVSEGAVGVEMVGPTHVETDPAVAWNVKAESEFSPSLITDDVFGNVPLLYHIAANTFYLDDVFFNNCEDHFTGLAYYG